MRRRAVTLVAMLLVGVAFTTVPSPRGSAYAAAPTLKSARGGALTAASGISSPYVADAMMTQQYHLTGSDGQTWRDIDPTNLSNTIHAPANASVILMGNADLWTANAGYNQDIGIFVSDNGGADQLLAWKESGGSAGIFSPNAAYVQTVFNITSGPQASSVATHVYPVVGTYLITMTVVDSVGLSSSSSTTVTVN